MAKLSPEQIEAAKWLHEEKKWSYARLAIKYGVSKQCIQQRINYKSRKSEYIPMRVIKLENKKLKLENEKLKILLRRNGIEF